MGLHKAIITAALNVLQNSGNAVPDGIAQSALMIPLRGMVLANIVRPEELDALANMVQFIYSTDLAPEYFEQTLRSFLEEQRSLRVLRDANLNAPGSLASSLSRAVQSAHIGRREATSPLVNPTIGEEEQTIPCGLEAIDGPMRGGLGRKRGGMICAFTGVGKTSLGLNFAWGAARQGYQARFCTLELPEDEISKRLMSLVARYSYERIQFGDRDRQMTREMIQEEVRQRIAINAGDMVGNIKVYDMSDETGTVPLIEEYLIRDEEAGCPADMLVVDWLECLEIPSVGQKKDMASAVLQMPVKELRHKLEKTAGDLVELAVRRNLSMWVLTQSDFKAEGKSKVTLSNKSEGKGSSRKMSWYLGVGMSPEDEQNNIVHVSAGKARNGRLFNTQLRRALHEQRFESLEAREESDPSAVDAAFSAAGFN